MIGNEFFCRMGVSLIVTGMLLSASQDAVAQERQETDGKYEVSGLVTDEFGNPLAGAAVIVRGQPVSDGVITDVDGTFSIMAPPRPVLMISYVGYRDVRYPMGNRKKVTIEMEEDTEYLDDVVVIGYGTQKKSDLTGSIASVDSKDIRNLPARSMAEALQGKVAGVMVSKNDGTPGSTSDIVIRGVGSINGLNPLFVIDGVAVGNTADYNLNDIESIEVIKDASAAAIYGSRAAGGVILVTTKTGRYNAAPRLSFSARVGVRSLSDMYTLLDTQDFVRVKQALGENNSIFNDPASLPYTDWPEEIYRDGIEHSYNLSLSGGSGKIRYYLAGAYERENGTQLESYWERISARLNVDYAVNKAVTVGTRIYFAGPAEDCGSGRPSGGQSSVVRKMGGTVRGDEMVGGCTPPAAWCGRSRKKPAIIRRFPGRGPRKPISSGKKRTMPCRYLHPNSSPTLHPVWSRLRDIDGKFCRTDDIY